MHERAGVEVSSWHRQKDDLLATGFIEQTGNAGNSPLYAVREGDERIRALDIISDVTAGYQLDEYPRPLPRISCARRYDYITLS